MPFLHNNFENNFQIGKYCLRQEVRAEEGRCGDQAAWRQPVARGRCSEDCEEPLICQLQVHRYDVDCGAFGSSDILIFQHFPIPRAQSAPCRLISEPPHDTVCFLHAPRTAHRAQPPGRAQSGGGGWSARRVYRVIYGDIWDMQTLPRLSTIYPPIYQHYEWSHHHHRHTLKTDTRGRDHGEC